MDLTKLVDLYIETNKKILSDDEHVVFKVYNNKLSVGIFMEESGYLWKHNKDSVIFFILKNEISHYVMVSYINNTIEYSNYFTSGVYNNFDISLSDQ